MEKPEYEWVGREPECGCCVALMIDDGSSDMYHTLGEWREEGLKVERVPRSDLKSIFAEDGFMGCPHGQLALEL